MRAVDRAQIARYAKALFCHADPAGFVLMRAFRGDSTQSWRPVAWSGMRVGEDLAGVIDAAARLAEAAAESGENIVFCPPVDLVVLSIIRHSDFHGLISAARSGDVAADAIISVVFSWLADNRSGLHRDCVMCGGVFRVTPPGLSVMTGTRRFHEAIVGGICEGCCAKPDGNLIELSLAHSPKATGSVKSPRRILPVRAGGHRDAPTDRLAAVEP